MRLSAPSLDDAAKQTIEEQKLQLASQPKMDISSFEDGHDLVAKLMVRLCRKLFCLICPHWLLTARFCQKMKMKLMRQCSVWLMKTGRQLRLKKKRKAKLGDVVLIDFTGRIDGEAFEGGAAQDHMLELGSNSFIPGFEDGLVGAEAGQTVDVKVSFPEEYQAAHLAGKEAVFECPVKEIHEKGKVKIDDDLASKLGFDNLEKLREAVAGQLASQHATALRAAVKTNVFDQLAEQADFDVPPSLMQSEYDVVAKFWPVPKITITTMTTTMTTAMQLMKVWMRRRKKKLRLLPCGASASGLMLTEIGQKNNIQVTEEDTRRAMIEQAIGSLVRNSKSSNIILRTLMPCNSWLVQCLKSW